MLFHRFVPATMTIVLLILTAHDTHAVNGNDWKQYSKLSRDTYVWGVVDTWKNIEQVDELKEVKSHDFIVSHYKPLLRCIGQNMTYGQLSAIVDKYIENNPALWHLSMSSLVWTAVHNVCNPTSR